MRARVAGSHAAYLYVLLEHARTAYFVKTEPIEGSGLWPPTQHALRRADGSLLVFLTYGGRRWYRIVTDHPEAPVTCGPDEWNEVEPVDPAVDPDLPVPDGLDQIVR
jgi:hypothetical protein